MRRYLFYPRREDGSAVGFEFEAYECVDDAEAIARAEKVLREHGSAVQVAIWQGDRLVGSRSQDQEI